MTHPQPSHTPAARLLGEDGQILVLTLVVALALLAILGLVADGGLLFARHRELQAVADAAARAGAAQLDEATYRASDGRTAQLDPTQASAAARRHPARRRLHRPNQHRHHHRSGHDWVG
jgi:hypothetical protein